MPRRRNNVGEKNLHNIYKGGQLANHDGVVGLKDDEYEKDWQTRLLFKYRH